MLSYLARVGPMHMTTRIASALNSSYNYVINKQPLAMGPYLWHADERSHGVPLWVPLHRSHGMQLSYNFWACFINQHFYMSITLFSTDPKITYSITITNLIWMQLDCLNILRCATLCLYQLPSWWITGVFLTSGKCGGILDWVILCRWRYITYDYETIYWKERNMVNLLFSGLSSIL